MRKSLVSLENQNYGAEGGNRTRTDIHPLSPEPSASTNSSWASLSKTTFILGVLLQKRP